MEEKNKKIKEIFNTYKSDFKKIRKEFLFLDIPEKEFIKIILRDINYSLNHCNNDNIRLYIIKKVRIDLLKITNNYLSDDEKSFDILNRYVYFNFTKTNVIKEILIDIDKLNHFLSSFSFIPNVNVIKLLISKNEIINNYLKIVYNNYKNYIISGELEKVSNNTLLTLFIECYCSLNNIEIKKSDEINNDIYNGIINNSLMMYFNDIPKESVLTREEEYDLFKRVKQGDKIAEELVVSRNLKLVISIAKKMYYSNSYKCNNMDMIDLIQEGNIGLLSAINKFDPTKGFKFSTYATWIIRQAIERAISIKERTVRIPCYILDKIPAYKYTFKKLSNELGRNPTALEISNAMNVPISIVNKIELYNNDIVSLNKTVGEENDTPLENFIEDESIESPDKEVIRLSCAKELEELLNNYLNEREITILKLRFGLNDENRIHTLEEIGKMYHVTRERIRQIVNKTLVKLYNCPDAKDLAIYLDNPDIADNLEKIKVKR